MHSEGAGMHPAHVMPHSEAGQCSLRLGRSSERMPQTGTDPVDLQCHGHQQQQQGGCRQQRAFPGAWLCLMLCREPGFGCCCGGSRHESRPPGCHPGSLSLQHSLPPAKRAAQGRQWIMCCIVLSQHLFLFHNLTIVRVLSRLNSR